MLKALNAAGEESLPKARVRGTSCQRELARSDEVSGMTKFTAATSQGSNKQRGVEVLYYGKRVLQRPVPDCPHIPVLSPMKPLVRIPDTVCEPSEPS